MIMPRRLFWLVAIVLCITQIIGCSSVGSHERVAFVREAVAAGIAESKSLDPTIAVLAQELATAQTELASAQGPAADAIRQFLDVTREKLNQAMEQKAKIDAAVVHWQAKAEEISKQNVTTIGDELQLVAEGVKQAATFTPAPFNSIVALVGSLMGIVGGALAARERAKRTQIDTAFEEVVNGVRHVLKELPPNTADAIKKTLGEEQTHQTEALVAAKL